MRLKISVRRVVWFVALLSVCFYIVASRTPTVGGAVPANLPQAAPSPPGLQNQINLLSKEVESLHQEVNSQAREIATLQHHFNHHYHSYGKLPMGIGTIQNMYCTQQGQNGQCWSQGQIQVWTVDLGGREQAVHTSGPMWR
jgi:hypothetical protein